MSTAIFKRLKNNTLSDKFIVTRFVAPGQYYDVDYKYWVQILDNEDLIADIVSGDLVVNDGTTDLSAADGQRLIERFQLDTASDIMFDNSTNGFASNNLQSAVEEIIDTPVGTTWQSEFSYGATVGNRWLELNDNIPSNQSPEIAIWKSKLIGMYFTNSNDGADGDIKIYVVDEDDNISPKIKIFEWQIRNCRVARKTNFSPDVLVEAGDKIAVFHSDQGTNTSDIKVKLIWKVLENNSEEVCKDYSGDFSLGAGNGTTSD